MEPCTHEVDGAEHPSPTASSSCASNLIKGFFTHPAAALLTGLGRGSVPSTLSTALGEGGPELQKVPGCGSLPAKPEGSRAQVKNPATGPARA